MTVSTARKQTVLAAIVLLGLVGCAPASAEPTPRASESPSPTATSTPTPTSAPVASAIVIDADDFWIRDADGEELSSFTYLDDPLVVVDALAEVFGAEPVVTEEQSDDVCTHAATIYTWDTAVVVVADDRYSPTYTLVSTQSDVSDPIQIETAGGVQVGDSFEDFLATVPDMPREIIDYEGKQLGFALESLSSYDAGNRPDADRHGIRIAAEDGVITHLSAPSVMNNPC